ncbi:MAG: transcriptional regulator, BlaI family [Phenylobacterium sp.]|jgi:BlaI family penicillinase repressor|uniref:BlaI/MecI/CopY family transcriptional regulator n=1 Tax=Phenylobacterium sp. TaxID=1871053 RepID=UPI002636FDF8|nr:BlaI/MecI/CopY family transcriptional regulator [Phenylobacterium sp.]MDB5461914.1 transcriptional regulator, BlaI family [Phenylobacterium sp.]MDB5499457.1 transcriptional regulator, BlaI family [Phenylobacterium sp.]
MTRISAAESQVMDAVWRKGPLAADEIVAEVGAPQGWGEATVKTLINRLLKKKALASERSEGRARYRPLVTREDYVQGESQGLLDRLFGGELAPLVAHYAKHRNLSPGEVARLKRLIEGLDDGE